MSPSPDSHMSEPIDSFASVPSRSMMQAKIDPVRRVITNKLPSSRSFNKWRGENERSPQPLPQSMATDASPYVTPTAQNHLCPSINAYVVSHHFPNLSPPPRRMQLCTKNLLHLRNTLNLISNLYVRWDLLGRSPRIRPQSLLQRPFIIQKLISIPQPRRSKKSVSSCRLVHRTIRGKIGSLWPKLANCTWK